MSRDQCGNLCVDIGAFRVEMYIVRTGNIVSALSRDEDFETVISKW